MSLLLPVLLWTIVTSSVLKCPRGARFLSTTLLLFAFPLLEQNSKEKGAHIIKGLQGNLMLMIRSLHYLTDLKL